MLFPRGQRPFNFGHLLTCVLTLLTVAGCDAVDLMLPAATSRVQADLSDAAAATLPDAGSTTFDGSLAGHDDVSMFSLGPVSRGDRLTINVSGHDGLNTVAALFNANGELIAANDDRSYYGGLLDPYINIVIRADETDVRLAVAISRAKYFSSSRGRFDSGSFTVNIDRKVDTAPDPRRQVVWLEFDGATNIRIAQEPAVDVPAFDAAKILPQLGGDTARIRDMVVERMRENLAPFNALVLRSDQDQRPDGPYTTVYFGGFNASFLGLSDNVDIYNSNLQQKAIVFTETLATFAGLNPSADDVARAMANVGTHELGHLMGLEHTSDPNDAMAPAASARQVFFIDAHYTNAPLDSDFFPIGTQNAPRQLTIALGDHPTDAVAQPATGQDATAADDGSIATSETPGACRIVSMSCGE